MGHALVYILAVGTLATAAALAAEGVLRPAGRTTRWPWIGAMVLTVALALTAPMRQPSPAPATAALRVLPAAARGHAGVRAPSRIEQGRQRLRAGGAYLASATDQGMWAVQRRLPRSVVAHAGSVWLAMSGTLLLLLVVVHGWYARVVSRLPAAIVQGQPVRVSASLGPVVIGVLQPSIVVPRWITRASDDAQRVSVAHEAEHAAARDPLLLLLGCAAVVALPWHPAMWFMLSRLRLAIEVDCDRRVLRRGITPRTYGTVLVDLAQRIASAPLGLPALTDHPSHLERRLLAMTSSPAPRARAITLGLVATLATLAACEARLPSSPEIERMDVAAVQESPLANLGAASAQKFYVDGVATTKEQALAVPAKEIASVAVSRLGANGASENAIHVQTLAGQAKADGVEVAGQAIRLETDRVVVDSPLEIRESGKFAGIVIIDGVKSDAAAMHRLDPNAIASIEVLKGGAAVRLYSESEAAQGVIRVTTKAGVRKQ